MDVYSFGVLLCEMCIRELPDPKQREEQVALVTNHVFRGLIRRCIQENPEARPNMEEIVDDLDSSWLYLILSDTVSQRQSVFIRNGERT